MTENHVRLAALGSFMQAAHLYSRKNYTRFYTREVGVVYTGFNGVYIAMSKKESSPVLFMWRGFFQRLRPPISFAQITKKLLW